MNINLTNKEIEILRKLVEREIGASGIFIKLLEEDLEELQEENDKEEIIKTEDAIEQRLKDVEESKELLRKLYIK